MGQRLRSFISVRDRQPTWNESERTRGIQLTADWSIWLCILQYICLFFTKATPNLKLPVRLRTAFTTKHAERGSGPETSPQASMTNGTRSDIYWAVRWKQSPVQQLQHLHPAGCFIGSYLHMTGRRLERSFPFLRLLHVASTTTLSHFTTGVPDHLLRFLSGKRRCQYQTRLCRR